MAYENKILEDQISIFLILEWGDNFYCDFKEQQMEILVKSERRYKESIAVVF